MSSGDYRLTIHIVRVPGDGNCLFTCISKAMVSVRRNATVYQLRKMVASRALDRTDKQFNDTLQTWCDLARAALQNGETMAHELAHVSPVAVRKPFVSKWNSVDRSLVYTNMMSPRKYWGDEIALDTLQRLLNVRFLVYNSALRTAMKPMPSSSSSQTFIVLEISGQHYNLIGASIETIKGRAAGGAAAVAATSEDHYVFSIASLPPPIRREFAQFL